MSRHNFLLIYLTFLASTGDIENREQNTTRKQKKGAAIRQVRLFAIFSLLSRLLMRDILPQPMLVDNGERLKACLIHCETGGKEAGKIYTDATWVSDKLPLGVRTQYIFGKWDPKGLLPNYDKQLRMQGRAFSKQLLGGAGTIFRAICHLADMVRPAARKEKPTLRDAVKKTWFDLSRY